MNTLGKVSEKTPHGHKMLFVHWRVNRADACKHKQESRSSAWEFAHAGRRSPQALCPTFCNLIRLKPGISLPNSSLTHPLDSCSPVLVTVGGMSGHHRWADIINTFCQQVEFSGCDSTPMVKCPRTGFQDTLHLCSADGYRFQRKQRSRDQPPEICPQITTANTTNIWS